MDEEIVAIIAGTVMVSIPLLAISARIALKPMVEAVVRLRGDGDVQRRAIESRRLQELEAEVYELREEVEALRRGRAFDAQLEAAADRDRLPGSPG